MKRLFRSQSPTTLLKKIRDEYSIHGRKIKPFASGVANLNFRIDGGEQSVVCRVYASRGLKHIQDEVRVLTALSAMGFPCPAPLQTRSKKFILRVDGLNAVVYPLLPGRHVTRVTPKIVREVGHLHGKLHALTAGKSFSISKPRWEPRDMLRLATAPLLAELRQFNFSSALPTGLTHQDIKPENVLLSDGHVSAFIDFDNAYVGALLFDVATTLIWFCASRGRISPKLVREFLKGYEAHRRLTRVERDAFCDALRWRLLRETVIWTRIAEGKLNPHADAKTKQRARKLRTHFFQLYRRVNCAEVQRVASSGR